MKRILIALVVFFFLSNTTHAQFPATSKEVTDILCAAKWKVDSIRVDGKTVSASEMGLEMEIVFRADTTYSMFFQGDTEVGKWTIDLVKKQVIIFEKDAVAKSIIVGLAKDRMDMINPEEKEMGAILTPKKD